MKKLLLALALVLGLSPVAQAATSYANPYGSGDRTSATMPQLIIREVAAIGLTDPNNLIDGVTNDNDIAFASGRTDGYIIFWFPFPAVIDEAKWYQSTTDSHGTWKWQGSNDRSSWTDIGSGFTLGGVTTQTQTSLNGNTTAYIFYRILQTAGSTSSTPFIHEVEFKIDQSGTASYLNTLGTGDRKASITLTSSGVTWTSRAEIVDGTLNNEAFVNGGATITSSFYTKFDFGSPYAIKQARWYQDSENNNGVWKWQGSNDDSSYVDVSGSFTLGVDPDRPPINTRDITLAGSDFSTNTTAYRYWKLTGVSGTTNSGPWIWEITFMIGATSGDLISTTFNAVWAGVMGMFNH